jgi:hypothetical protein
MFSVHDDMIGQTTGTPFKISVSPVGGMVLIFSDNRVTITEGYNALSLDTHHYIQ